MPDFKNYDVVKWDEYKNSISKEENIIERIDKVYTPLILVPTSDTSLQKNKSELDIERERVIEIINTKITNLEVEQQPINNKGLTLSMDRLKLFKYAT
jgi:hypothetical protein